MPLTAMRMHLRTSCHFRRSGLWDPLPYPILSPLAVSTAEKYLPPPGEPFPLPRPSFKFIHQHLGEVFPQQPRPSSYGQASPGSDSRQHCQRTNTSFLVKSPPLVKTTTTRFISRSQGSSTCLMQQIHSENAELNCLANHNSVL